jgi:hypothetical protein
LCLRKSLRRLVTYRRQNGIPIGSASGWARAAAYVSRLLDEDDMSFATVNRRAKDIGLDIDRDTTISLLMRATDEIAGSSFTVSAVQIGSDVALLRDERTAIGNQKMRHIDACDEPKRERQKRLKKEAQARRRAREGATPRDKSVSQERPWEAMGCSRATYYRMRQIRSPISLKKYGEGHETVSLPGEHHETVSHGRVKYGSAS